MLKQYYFLLRRLVWGVPSLYLPVLNLRNLVKGTIIESSELNPRLHPNARAITHKGTDIVVEAFQRSGNTFAEIAIRYAQSEALDIAHHHHSPAQIVKAAELGIPTLVIIRGPKSAVISARQRVSKTTCAILLRDYISFYTTIWPHRSFFFVARFEDVTSDFGSVIAKMNSKLGTNFVLFVHDDKSESDIFSEIEKRNSTLFGGGQVVESMVARPSKSRINTRTEILTELEEGKNPGLLQEAESLFHRYLAHIQKQV